MILKTELYPWQRAAADKLIGIRVGAIYAEMGTGKTRMALELIQRRLASGKLKHVLWLCPCSVRDSLKAEIGKHADGALTYIAIYGIESLSSSLSLYEHLRAYTAADDTMLIVDESNLVKNPKALRAQRVIALAKACKYRLILNGTPISRNEADLFAQWYLLDWRILGYRSFYSFAANHLEYDPIIPNKIRRTLNTDYLVEKIAPYTFQVSREECFTLPGKQYQQVDVLMTDAQQNHYNQVIDAMIERIDEQRPETIYRMFSAAQAIISGLIVEDNGRNMDTSSMFENPLDNPRIVSALNLLDKLNGKVIIFCKYTHEIDALLSILSGSVPFYGKLNRRERQASLDAFRNGARYLIANKACAGYGLNLQFCSNIIYYSNDWDWATRIQSEDRVYRLGQQSQVHIYDLCAVGSLDQKILRCLAKKERLEDAIKRELNAANETRSARGEYRKWLKGELEEHGKAIS